MEELVQVCLNRPTVVASGCYGSKVLRVYEYFG